MFLVRPQYSTSCYCLCEHRDWSLGFTILDNVIMFEGTFYIVVDDLTSMPAIESIASSRVNKNDPPRDIDWQIFPGQTAFSKFDSYGGRCVSPLSLTHGRLTDTHHILCTLLMTEYTASHSYHMMAPPQQIHTHYSPSCAYTAHSTYLHLNLSLPLIASSSPLYLPSRILFQSRTMREFHEYGQISG
jgi:hypothetical protein